MGNACRDTELSLSFLIKIWPTTKGEEKGGGERPMSNDRGERRGGLRGGRKDFGWLGLLIKNPVLRLSKIKAY